MPRRIVSSTSQPGCRARSAAICCRPDDVTALWHPFADMAAVAGSEVVIARGEGVHVWDEGGTRYLDGASALWYANAGHGRPEIRAAIERQLGELDAFHTFGDLANRPALELADRLAGLAPQPDSKVFLTSGGGDSIETAVKLARRFHSVSGAPGRSHVISRTNGYHGTHGIGTSILGLPYREGFTPLVEDTSRVAWDDLAALEAEIERVGADRVAAFVFEPVIGSGGVLVAPDGYLSGVQELCRRHGILTIADVVIGGFGRLGDWLGVGRFGLEPDLIVFAKGVTSGVLPLGGAIVAPRVAEPFWSHPGGPIFEHGLTYSGHPVCCAAALANLDVLEQEGLIERTRTRERSFHDRLSRRLAPHALVREVRGGIGLMAAVALDAPERASQLQASARAHGLLTRWLPDGVAVAPPLVISDAEIGELVDILAAALDDVAG
ncbi:MAG TPA: aspartate aminotransferase family protein [Gaiellales bacterium]|jgi:adenosylmethionine-8-amino-7-oxononanoate aminotransferase